MDVPVWRRSLGEDAGESKDAMGIPHLSSQSERAKNTIHCFSIY